MNEAALRDAVVRKNAYAEKTGADVRLVTQFSFVAEPVIAWDKAIAPINKLPIYIGLPGLAKASTLLKYALDCGVGPSLQAFSKHATQLSKLLTVSAPDEQLVALASTPRIRRRRSPATSSRSAVSSVRPTG